MRKAVSENPKPAGGMVREHFARGCAETMEYLRGLIEEVDLVGMPEAAPEAPPAPFIPEEWHFKKVAAVIACWAGEPTEAEDVIKIEWPPHGDGRGGRDREFADSPLEEAGFELRPSATHWDRGFAGSPLEQRGFELMVPP